MELEGNSELFAVPNAHTNTKLIVLHANVLPLHTFITLLVLVLPSLTVLSEKAEGYLPVFLCKMRHGACLIPVRRRSLTRGKVCPQDSGLDIEEPCAAVGYSADKESIGAAVVG